MGQLNIKDIRRLHKLAVGLGLADNRDALMAGLDGGFVAQLKLTQSPSQQLFQDLDGLNSADELTNGQRPLETWLCNAETLVQPKVEARKFRSFLAKSRKTGVSKRKQMRTPGQAKPGTSTSRGKPVWSNKAVGRPRVEGMSACVQKQETLYSNLLPLRSYPSVLYVAPTLYRDYGALWANLRGGSKQHVSGAWLLHEGNLLSFADLSKDPFRAVCDFGAMERHDTVRWAESDDPVRSRQFVQLLKGALRDDLGAHGVHYWREDDVHYFAGSLEKGERFHVYHSIKRASKVRVVKVRTTKSADGEEKKHLRHVAFMAKFHRIADQWYLEINPTYRFTSDGKHKYAFHEEQLSGMKALEGNRAVLAQILLWADTLRPQPTLFSKKEYLLAFDGLLEFRVGTGLIDELWQHGTQNTSADSDFASASLGLFDPKGEDK